MHVPEHQALVRRGWVCRERLRAGGSCGGAWGRLGGLRSPRCLRSTPADLNPTLTPAAPQTRPPTPTLRQRLVLFDYDWASANDEIGRAELAVSDLAPGRTHHLWLDVGSQCELAGGCCTSLLRPVGASRHYRAHLPAPHRTRRPALPVRLNTPALETRSRGGAGGRQAGHAQARARRGGRRQAAARRLHQGLPAAHPGGADCKCQLLPGGPARHSGSFAALPRRRSPPLLLTAPHLVSLSAGHLPHVQ